MLAHPTVHDSTSLPQAGAEVSGPKGSSGYQSSAYAASLAEFGDPLALPQCGGWLLERPIAASGRKDAMGCYPMFSCCDWSKLGPDLDSLAGRLLTVAVVVDPFSPLGAAELGACFDLVKPFKDHFVVDLAVPREVYVTTHHRRYARKSLRKLRVQTVDDPSRHLEQWVALYANLTQRHQIRGMRAFSRESFRRQLEAPGMVMFTGTLGDQIVGAHLWYVQGEVAYSHLSATNDTGYECRAAYGIHWTAIETFQEQFGSKLRWLDLGGSAGLASDAENGLALFKQQWSTGTRRVFFCGRIYDPPAYAELSRTNGAEQVGYFPAYRYGEF
jgi:hypothetical protein